MTKKRTIVLFIVILILVGLSWPIGRAFFFWPTGSRSGKVIDAATGQPIKEAVVYYQWKLQGVVMWTGEYVAASDETKTNKDGEYYIPNLWIRKHSPFLHEKSDEMIVYKEGYMWCRADYGGVRHFMTYMSDVNLPYKKKQNLVKLQPWISEFSHGEHMADNYLDEYSRQSTMLNEALKSERGVAEREHQSSNAQSENNTAIAQQLYDAKQEYEKKKISREEYIKHLKTGVPVLIELLWKNLYRRHTFGEIFVSLQRILDREDLLVGSDRIQISRDISERKQAITELEKAYQEFTTESEAEYYGNVALTSKDCGTFCKAIRILGESKDKEATVYLLKCLDEKNETEPEVCCSAMDVLSKNGDTSVIPKLKSKLNNDQSMHIRQQAAIALHRLGDDSGVPIMIESLGSQDLEEQAGAVYTISKMANQDFCGKWSFSRAPFEERKKIIQNCLNWCKTSKDSLSTK